MNLLSVLEIEKPLDTNFILGQSHFIKTVEDMARSRVFSPGIKFGLAFCEASGKCLIRSSGSDPTLVELAEKECLGDWCWTQFYIVSG